MPCQGSTGGRRAKRRMLTGQEGKRGAVVASTPSRRASYGTAVAPRAFWCTSEAAGHGRWDAATGRLRRGRSVQMRLSRGGSHSSRETDTQEGPPKNQARGTPAPNSKFGRPQPTKRAAFAASRHEGEVAEYASCRSGCGCGFVGGRMHGRVRACVRVSVCGWAEAAGLDSPARSERHSGAAPATVVKPNHGHAVQPLPLHPPKIKG